MAETQPHEDRLRDELAAIDARFDAMEASLDEFERLLFPQRSQPKPKPNFTVIEGGSAPS